MTTKIRKNVYIEKSAEHDLRKFADRNALSFSQAVSIAAWRLVDNPSMALRKIDEKRKPIMSEEDYFDRQR